MIKIINLKKRKNKGYALIEVLFYISFFAIFSILIINSMIIMLKSYKEIMINSDFVQGSIIMDRISREIRNSYDVNNISTNSLALNISNEGQLTEKVITFLLNNSNVEFYDNNVFIGNLNSQNIIVNDLIFTEIITSKGKAIKIFLTLKSNRYSSERIENFYDTIVLRNNY